jgi:hypothetical protein
MSFIDLYLVFLFTALVVACVTALGVNHTKKE